MKAKNSEKTTNTALICYLDYNSLCLESIYKDYFKDTYNFVKRQGGSLDDAKELFQEALLIFLSKLKKNEFLIQVSLKSYLYTIAKNLWIKGLKIKKNTKLILDDPEFVFDLADEHANVQIELEKAEARDRYIAYLHLLDTKSRELFLLKLEHNLSDREIAEQLGYTLDYVRQKRRRCLNYLRTKYYES